MSVDEEWVPGNKSDLMSAIQREWTLLMDVVSKLDEQKMTTPDEGGWSPKDNLAHIAEWLNALMGYHMDKRPSHEVFGFSEDVTKEWDFNEINAELFERSKDRSTQEVLNGVKSKYEETIKKLEAVPFEDLLKQRYDDDPERTPLLIYVLANTTRHFAEHRATIEKML